MSNNLFPEKDYIGLGDGPIDWTVRDQGFGAALKSAVSSGFKSSPTIGTGVSLNQLPSLAKTEWMPFIGREDSPDVLTPLITVDDPVEVAARGDKLFQTEDELKGYAGYNSKIPFELGMTQNRYDALVEARTEQLRREAATAGRPFTNVFGQVIGGAPDPSNYIPLLGQLGAAWKLNKGVRLGWNAVKSGSEAAIGSTLATGLISSAEKAKGNDMSLKTYVETASLGFLIGSVFGTLGHGIARALNTKTVKQAAASQTIVSSPITPQSAPDAVAVLADAYDSFMVNNGLATPFAAGGKGGPIMFGAHSQKAFTEGLQAAQKSVDLNWANLIYRRKNEMEPLPALGTLEEKYALLKDIGTLRTKQKENYDATVLEEAEQRRDRPNETWDHDSDIKRAKDQYEQSIKDYNQLKQELDDYYTIEVDKNVMSRIIDDPVVKQRMIGSQVKDATGKPITLFIGTQYGTSTRLGFDKKMTGKNTGGVSSHMALWATDNPNDASGYAMNNYLDHLLSDEMGDEGFQNPPTQSPNVRPILLDMKNPMIVDYTGRHYEEFRHADSIKKAKELGHDGVIFKNIVDTPDNMAIHKDQTDLLEMANKALTPSTHYAIFDPKQIIDLQDVSADFGKVIDAQQAYLDARANKPSTQFDALKGTSNEIPKGYNYDSQAAATTVVSDVATNKFIDVLPLIRATEKNDEIKYQEVSNEAADLDIEAKTTGFEDEMELALASVPIRPEEEAFALKVDADIAAADKLEVFMNTALKCIE